MVLTDLAEDYYNKERCSLVGLQIGSVTLDVDISQGQGSLTWLSAVLESCKSPKIEVSYVNNYY